MKLFLVIIFSLATLPGLSFDFIEILETDKTVWSCRMLGGYQGPHYGRGPTKWVAKLRARKACKEKRRKGQERYPSYDFTKCKKSQMPFICGKY